MGQKGTALNKRYNDYIISTKYN